MGSKKVDVVGTTIAMVESHALAVADATQATAKAALAIYEQGGAEALRLWVGGLVSMPTHDLARSILDGTPEGSDHGE